MSNHRSAIALVALLLGASSPAGAAPPAAADAEPEEILIVDAYLLEAEPAGDGAWLVEVDEALGGAAPGSVLAVDELPAALRSLGSPVGRAERLRLVLTPGGEGRYRVLSGHVSPLVDPAPELPESAPPAVVADDLAGPAPLLAEPKAAPAATFEDQVMALVNQERWADGMRPPYKRSSLLDSSSELHSGNMAARDFFGHCDPDTLTRAGQRAGAAGYFGTVQENIAAGQANPVAVMTSWMGSAGHRAAILSTGHRELGIGYVLQSNDQANVSLDLNGDCVGESTSGPFLRYWTQNFGSRSGVYPVVIDREAHSTTSRSVDLYVYGTGFATQMRFSNDGASWSSWQTFNPNKSWTLSAGAGWKTVHAQIRNGSGTPSQASDRIYLDAPCTSAAETLSLPSGTVSSSVQYQACDTISAVQGHQVGSSGDLLLQAGRRVVLGDGFRVLSGGRLRVLIQSPP